MPVCGVSPCCGKGNEYSPAGELLEKEGAMKEKALAKEGKVKGKAAKKEAR
jgi:hypothetical protein